MMNVAVIMLGSNTGNRLLYIEKSLSLITTRVGAITKISHVYETEPWGFTNQPLFYNQVAEVNTALTPESLMTTLLEIEKELGRERILKWEPRLIDLDILYFNSEIINERELTIPHPHLHERRFTLIPLSEILPEMVHPVLGKTNNELLSLLEDDLGVKQLKTEIQMRGI